MTTVVPLHRTLAQEVLALERGASLECLVCGEFVLRSGDGLTCPECGSVVRAAAQTRSSQLEFDVQAG